MNHLAVTLVILLSMTGVIFSSSAGAFDPDDHSGLAEKKKKKKDDTGEEKEEELALAQGIQALRSVPSR
jgi:hypothetical protein